MGTARVAVLTRQPFVPRYDHCLILPPLWVSREDKEHHHRAFCVTVRTVNNTTTDWHRVLKKLRLKFNPLFMKDVFPRCKMHVKRHVFTSDQSGSFATCSWQYRTAMPFLEGLHTCESVSGILKRHKLVTCRCIPWFQSHLMKMPFCAPYAMEFIVT